MFDVVVVSEIGERDSMEDTYFLDVEPYKSIVFCGIYDGHAGKLAAEYAKDNLHKFFFKELGNNRDVGGAFRVAYQKTSDHLGNQDSGTTAVTFYIQNNRLFYAHAGDARLILINESGTIQLTHDHRITNPSERQRIIDSGGTIIPPYVYKGQTGLMPTRTIGDEYFKDIGIIAIPETGERPLVKKERWLLAGTDGLFDVLENNEIRILINKYNNPKDAAGALKDEIFKKQSGSDNLTFILVKLN